MIISYALRLVCLSLAVFLLVYTSAGLLVAMVAPAAVRAAERLRPRQGARLLLVARLLPAAAALVVVAVFCIPSYLWLEQEPAGEEVGLACLTAALACAAIWAASIAKAALTWLRSAGLARRWKRAGVEARFAGEPLAASVIASAAPLVALTGVWRPRVVLSSAVMDALSPEQLSAALRHEQAHIQARDNLKRLLLIATPGVLPRLRRFTELETQWSRMSEWAADDESAGGEAVRSLSLAAALLCVARLGSGLPISPVQVSFLPEGDELAGRIDRLLHPRQFAPERPPQAGVLTASAALTVAASLVALTLQPQALESAYRFFEQLVH